MTKKNQPKKPRGLLLALILLLAAGIAAVLLWTNGSPKVPVPSVPSTAAAGETEPSWTEPAAVEPQSVIDLGHGLRITDSGSYSGLYMEDGSNELVSDVMMVVVENTGEDDIQLAELTALSGGEEFRFRLTNLAAGKRAVLLDRDRRAAGGASLESAVLDSVALFPEPMELYEDVIGIGGLEGMLNVQNISGSDIDGDIYIYYKYAAQDLFYGGITFRVRIQGGLAAGELRQIPAGHFDPDGCEIIQVTIYE